MKKEDLFDGFGNLDEDLLRRSEQGGKKMSEKRKLSKIVQLGSIAACLVVALGVGMVLWGGRATNGDKPSEDNVIAEKKNNGDDSVIQDNVQGESEAYVDVSALLASNEGIEKELLLYSNVEVGKYIATYFKVASVESVVLGENIGDDIEGTQNWYRVSGHEDLYYLIFYNNDEYSLWKFGYFKEENYPYADVLQLIYNINSAEDIAEIVVEPATMDNTDDGKAIQNEVGTAAIVDGESIKEIYDVLSGLTCYGSDNWDMIDLGDDTPSAMSEQVRAGRYLTFVTSEGMEIDTIKYTGISGMFYELGGVAYNELSVKQKEKVEEILNIEFSIPSRQEGEQQAIEPEVNTEIQDAPVDESTYQEARDYSAELTDLQNRITQAMTDKKLPFVTSCSIYENPDRVQVEVNTKDEELLAKLRSFDPTGELLEIVYSSGSAVLE